MATVDEQVKPANSPIQKEENEVIVKAEEEEAKKEPISHIKFAKPEDEEVFAKFINETLPPLLLEADYDELYGYQLSPVGDYFDKKVRDVLIYKFLKANTFDLNSTKDQLLKTLNWRKEFKPLQSAFAEEIDPKFADIGVLTKNGDDILTWNIYGASKDLFKDLDKFIRFRIGLMEKGLQLLDFTSVEDSYLGQIHDYDGVSFLRFDSKTREASKKVISLFQDYYPELLSKKIFLNVPTVMAWVYDLIKGWLPTETTKKFKMLNDGKKLSSTIGDEDVPVKYGGKGKELKLQDITDIDSTPYTKFIIQSTYVNEVD